MRRFILILLFAACAAPLFSVTAQNVELDATFVDPEGRYTFDYPASWRVVQNSSGVDIGIPNNNTSPSMYFTSGDDPVELITFFQLVDGEPQALLIGDRAGAKLVVHEPYFSSGYFAIEYVPNRLALITLFASKWEVERWEPIFLAMLESLRIPDADEVPSEPAVVLEDALELESTYEDRNITFGYPETWYTSSYQGRIALSNVQSRAQYREPEFVYLNPGEVVVLIFPNIELLPGIVQAILEEDEHNAYDVAVTTAITVLVEASSYNFPDTEEFEINGQDAAMTTLASESEDYIIISIELGNDDVATVIGVVEVEEMHLHQNTIMAIAESLTLLE